MSVQPSTIKMMVAIHFKSVDVQPAIMGFWLTQNRVDLGHNISYVTNHHAMGDLLFGTPNVFHLQPSNQYGLTSTGNAPISLKKKKNRVRAFKLWKRANPVRASGDARTSSISRCVPFFTVPLCRFRNQRSHPKQHFATSSWGHRFGLAEFPGWVPS